VRVSDFHFDLPPDLIAQHPPAERDAARMLTVDRATGRFEDRNFIDLPDLLQEGDLLILNNSRVIPARLFARRTGLRTQRKSPAPTGQIEVLLTQPLGGDLWRALVKPGKKVQVGERLVFGADELRAQVLEAGDFGERTLSFASSPDFFATLERIGHMPLPPYIHRSDSSEDRSRYQTVFSDIEQKGSAAAPTAGLHFTPEILNKIRDKSVQVEQITLHVGLGTFQPLRVENLSEIHLHEEPYTLPVRTAEAINQAKAEGRRVVAVGTTTVRTLEHCASLSPGQPLLPHTGTTSIFLSPGYQFQVVDALLTNFHLPQSTLLMLVSAFAGREHVLAAYRHAVASRYRFFSYGDCMFLS
jgi:S-adenosylmethionine:tRNA ribosyltransferase-isomerase